MNKQKSIPMVGGHVVAIGVVLFAVSMLGGQDNQMFPSATIDAAPNDIKLTSTLATWISSQTENIVEEMDAIARQQAETKDFSVVYYVRYLQLYESLAVVAKRDNVDKFQWIARKLKAFKHVHSALYTILVRHLDDLDTKLKALEDSEPKSKSVRVSDEWVKIYETVNYIKSHISSTDPISKQAASIINKSPTRSNDKKRSIRYHNYRTVRT